MSMVVNETKLNAAMTATADAIREKLGSEETIPFDYENGKGFAEAVEAIPQGGGDPYKIVNQIIDGTLLYFKSNLSGAVPFTANNNVAYKPANIVFFSMKNAFDASMSYVSTTVVPNGLFISKSKLKYICMGCEHPRPDFVQHIFNGCSALKCLILRAKKVISNGNNNVTINSGLRKGIGFLYVPDLDSNGNNLPTQYKSATNWSVMASQIRGYSEAPAYDSSTTYEIGDVCKYNGRFYGYCKEDLASSTGNAPSGTTEDNAYWEYVDEIEV